jgi:hypothetical protein
VGHDQEGTVTPYPSEIGKTQQVRLVDVFLLGPFMVWFAATATSAPQWARLTLAVAGVLTSLYNGYHFVREEAAHGV